MRVFVRIRISGISGFSGFSRRGAYAAGGRLCIFVLARFSVAAKSAIWAN